MACTCLGEAPRVHQQQKILPTSNLTNKNLISMPFFSDNLFDTEIAPDQTDQAPPPSPIHAFNPHRYIPPTSPAYSTDSQATPYSPSLHLDQPQTPKFITLYFTAHPTSHNRPQQCQPLEWIPILLIPNNLNYIHVVVSTPPSTISPRPNIWKMFSSS